MAVVVFFALVGDFCMVGGGEGGVGACAEGEVFVEERLEGCFGFFGRFVAILAGFDFAEYYA